MTSRGIIIRVDEMLVSAGYSKMGAKIEIGTIPFQFDSILVSDSFALDLVLVVDVELNMEGLRTRIRNLSRALDLDGSRRSITAILVAPVLNSALVQEIAALCRVLVLEGLDNEMSQSELHEALAILLPFDLPESKRRSIDAVAAISGFIPNGFSPMMQDFTNAAAESSGAVESVLKSHLAMLINEQNGESS
jgi:hypothetical protein